ncbi:MAG TPA: TetR family transcriptional regulator [Thermoleophilaceae bacterium]|nr:TetR family transcriptional regulator [Thermoleophilaceae bacterium]
MPARRLTRKEKQADTRCRLIEAAARVFARRGLHHASIDDVAAEAGFTKGAFYANFASKEELFLAMLDEKFAARLAELERTTGTDETPEEQARQAGSDFSRAIAADPEWERLFFEFAAHAGRNEEFRKELVSRYRALRGSIEELYRRRLERDVHMEEPPLPLDKIALMTFAMVNGMALEKMLEPDAVDDELYGAMLMVFFSGLRALVNERSAARAG